MWTKALAMLGLLLLGADPGAASAPGPAAEAAWLDLREAPLDREVLSLNGAWWEFHRGQLLEPGALGTDGPSPQGTASLIPWKRMRDASGKAYPDTGFATYRLRLRLDSARVKRLAFALKEAGSAQRLWVDGRLVLACGVPGRNLAEEVPAYVPTIGEVDVHGPVMDLVLQTSNFHADNGGVLFPLRIGPPDAVRSTLFLHAFLQALVLGMLLLFAFLHLHQWWRARSERTSLVFAGYCLVWCAIVLTESGEVRLLTLAFPDFPFELHNRIDYLATLLMPLLTSLFAQRLFPDRLLEKVNRIFLGLVGVACLPVLLLPMRGYLPWIPGEVVVSCLVLVPIVLACVKGFRRGVPHARLFLFGYLIFMAGAFHDAALYLGGFGGSYLITYTAAALVLCQAMILSGRSALLAGANRRLLDEVQGKNDELERLSRIKDDFLANTSHELRTPLHGIMGIAEVGLSLPEASLPHEIPPHLHSIRRSAARLARLVDDLLDFSKLRHADIRLRPRPLDLGALAARLMEPMRPLARPKGLALEVDLEPGLGPVVADPDRLEQILLNLLGNAVKFTLSGCVRLEARREGELVRIGVRDTGPGIPPQERDRVFQAFEQGQSTRGGTGLGLAIARHLVELHGGTLALDSTPGEGSCFSFALRLGDASEEGIPLGDAVERPFRSWEETAELELPTPVEVEHPRATVLAVDDEPLNLRILNAHLSARGYRVLCLDSGQDMIAVIEHEQPAVVLLDVMMPGEDGYALCRRLRERWDGLELPVLFVTARGRMEDLERGFEAGGNDYLVKPFLRDELLARVDLHVQQQAQARRHGEPSWQVSRVMRLVLESWIASGGKGVLDLAEASGLWTVHTDADGWSRAQTLERYLDPDKAPKNPRWKTVEATVRFVLDRSAVQQPPQAGELHRWLESRRNDD